MEEEIIKAINKRMVQLGISRRQLSKACGISEQMLYLFTNRGGNISITSLAKICNVLQLKIEVSPSQHKTLLLMAIEAEMGADNIAAIAERCDVRLIGMGKLAAFEATMEAMLQGNYDNVINVGTCGSFRHPFATVLRPSEVKQGDAYIDPESIFYTEAEVIATGYEGCSIVSSDNFIGDDTPAKQRALLSPNDCMDMEAYAVVRAVRLHARLRGTNAATIYMAKVVSDGCDGTVGDWESRIKALQPTVRQAAEKILDTIELRQR